MNPTLCAAIQLRSGPDRAHNQAAALGWVRKAAQAGARVVALPEMWEHIGPAAQKRAFAGALDGPQLAPLRELCRELALCCVAGSIAERAPDGRFYNTSAVIGPSGEILAAYRKLHLFDVAIPDGAAYRESESVAPGDALPPCTELPGLGLRAGLSICYDLRFPELYRAHAAAGADLLLVPAAFTAYTGRAHWEVLLRARAIENQAFVVAPAQVGTIGEPAEGRQAFGHACVVDPWGEVLADAGGQGEGFALAALDPERLARARRELPALGHRRRDLYP